MRLLEVYRRHLVNKLQVIVKMRSFSLSSTRLGKSIYVLIELPEPMEVACFASKWFPIVGFTLDVEMIATGNLSVDNPGDEKTLWPSLGKLVLALFLKGEETLDHAFCNCLKALEVFGSQSLFVYIVACITSVFVNIVADDFESPQIIVDDE
ncbi:hypothetical protein HPP92_018913 [Vanilla planifolia]|uniref:Uncharacterized protein n=1 Tax=Vanilla planifolia TaxID=51239 RepID=A0A835Q337_VANPL|nr:hypothetical protein HPP92_018913 [Vanilla planifolia]